LLDHLVVRLAFQRERDLPIDYFNLLWAGVAMLFTFVAFLVCFERPREPEAFRIDEPSWIGLEGTAHACTITRIGMDSAVLQLPATAPPLVPGLPMHLYIESAGWVAAHVDHRDGDAVSLALEPEPAQREALILRLFTTAVDPIARTASLGIALRGLAQRCFRAA